MKKVFYHIGFVALAVAFTACGGSKNEGDSTEAVPAETSNEEDMPQEVFNTLVGGRLQVSMDDVGETGDTAASMISGYIDIRNAGAETKDLQLLLHTSPYQGKDEPKDYVMRIEADGRVPGNWVAPHSNCDFTLVAVKDTFRFSTKTGINLYRFKMSFKPKV